MSGIEEVRTRVSVGSGAWEKPLGDVLEFMRLLWAVDHRLKSTSKRMEATMGITGPQRLVLRLVGRFPGITAGRLARILLVHPSTITGILRRLEERHYLTRGSDPLDRRKALFSLTEKGRALDVPSDHTVEAAVQRLLTRLPKAQLAVAQEVFTVLAAELGSENAPDDDAPGEPEPALG